MKQQVVDCAKAKLEHQARKKAEYGLRGSDQKAARLRNWLMRASSLLATEQFGRMTAAQLRVKLDAIQRLKLQGEKQVPKLSSRKPEVTLHMHAVTPAALQHPQLQQLASARARESPAQSTSASSAVASARALEMAAKRAADSLARTNDKLSGSLIHQMNELRKQEAIGLKEKTAAALEIRALLPGGFAGYLQHSDAERAVKLQELRRFPSARAQMLSQH